jgi:hypothetical protein
LDTELGLRAGATNNQLNSTCRTLYCARIKLQENRGHNINEHL